MGRRARAAPARRTQPQSRGRASRHQRKAKGEYTGEDFNDLVEQLKPLGLSVRRMEADGNCLFRAFADQLIGDSEEHMQFREECCDYMLANAEELQLFHADEDFEECESFEDYVEHMRSPCRWGSQLELMALCRRHGVNAIVHQSGLPAYEMVVAPLEARCLQLSYHDGEHYNSIRFARDMEPGRPARCLSLQQVRGQSPEGQGAEARGGDEDEEPEANLACGGEDEEEAGAASGAAAAAAAAVEEAPPGPSPSSPAEGCRAAAAEAAEAAEGAEGDAQDAPAEAPAAAASTAAAAAGRGARASRSEKRTERRRAKEAADRRRKAASSEAGAAEESLAEALSLLTKQLITV